MKRKMMTLRDRILQFSSQKDPDVAPFNGIPSKETFWIKKVPSDRDF